MSLLTTVEKPTVRSDRRFPAKRSLTVSLMRCSSMSKRPAERRGTTAKRIDQALEILASLNVPREQQNERSALVLLALLGMTPIKPWSAATDPMRGITEMMKVFRDQFGKEYAPNTRETVRRFTIHQFVQIGLVVANPDDPQRPVNSPPIATRSPRRS